MTALQFALYCRRIRLTNTPAALAQISEELDRLHPHSADSADSDALVKMATLKRVSLLQPN